MLKPTLTALTLALGLSWAQAAPLFQTVGAEGSTTPATNFSVSDSAPWLHVALDGPLDFFTWITAQAVFDADPSDNLPGTVLEATRFGTQGNAQFWFAPTEASWEAARAPGNWQFRTQFHEIELICIYGVCAPGGSFSVAGPVTDFTVGGATVTPVPEPSSLALMVLGLLGLMGVRLGAHRQPRQG